MSKTQPDLDPGGSSFRVFIDGQLIPVTHISWLPSGHYRIEAATSDQNIVTTFIQSGQRSIRPLNTAHGTSAVTEWVVSGVFSGDRVRVEWEGNHENLR